MKKSFLFLLTVMIIGFLSSCEDKNTPYSGGGGNGGNSSSEATFVDLGLPSGTLWKSINESNKNDDSGLYTFDEAVAAFGTRLPNKTQCQELLDMCTWTWENGTCKITGPNKKSITLPAAGFIEEDDKGVNKSAGEEAYYWTSESYDNENAWAFVYETSSEKGISDKGIDWTEKSLRAAVRLVQTGNTPSDVGSVKTVEQIMNIYTSLGLTNGESAKETYTVRGYVTKWNSGYPNYQNADFYIDDTANGSTSRLKCFRLTGLTDSDKRTLNVGDYVEAQNCNLMNYNGAAELTNGTFTVIHSPSTKVPVLSDFLGTFSCHAHRYKNNDYVDWNDVVISEYYEEGNTLFNVMVEGLIYGQSAYTALGHFDETKGCIRLFGDWFITNHTCTINAKGDTLLYPIFYPMYVDKNNNEYYLESTYDGQNIGGELLLIRNNDGTLSFTASDKADNNGRYANVYRFKYFRASNTTDTGYTTILYALNGTTLTKSSAQVPSLVKTQKTQKAK